MTLPKPHYLSNEQLDEVISHLIEFSPSNEKEVYSYMNEKLYRMEQEISMTYETNPPKKKKYKLEKKQGKKSKGKGSFNK